MQYASHIPSTIEFVAMDCQIRSSFCQFGCEVIVVCYETGGRTIRRRHAYLHLPFPWSKPQPWYHFTITSLSSLLDNAGSFWWFALRATDALGHHCLHSRFWQSLWKGIVQQKLTLQLKFIQLGCHILQMAIGLLAY